MCMYVYTCMCMYLPPRLTHIRGKKIQVKAILDQIKGREWGLMILDEVHVAPAR